MSSAPPRIGSYPIEREVGRGGMGVVYLGRDTRLDRRVAIKVLPDTLAADPERLARFEREARLLASLHHPNIAGIYGLEEDAGRRYLVLEYVEGENLAERLARGPMPIDEALEVCRQVAAALEAAHENGVVHRDLKPANVKLTLAGEVKVLDFGLAKGPAGSTPATSPDLSQSPTLAPAATMEGVILGTAAYMSPEQARGRMVDKRTDIWAFGCLLYECLTAKTAFAGETVSDTIARILQGEPDWKDLPANTPERLRGLLRRCLEKDVRRRVRDIGDAKIEIEDLQTAGSSASGVRVGDVARPLGLRHYSREIGIAVLVALVSVVATKLASRLIHVGPPDPTTLTSRFEVQEPAGSNFVPDAAASAISPDGRSLAFVAIDSLTVGRIWLHSIESAVAKPLPGTEGAIGFFWAPDSRSIGFFTPSKLKKVAVSAGAEPEALCDVKRARGGAWGKDGTILFAPLSNGPLFKIAAGGGEPTQVTAIDSAGGETAHRAPIFLPDGNHFLYSSLPAREGKFDIFLASLRSPRGKKILSAESGVAYARGSLLYLRGGKLVAQRFGRGLRPSGEPVSLGDVPAGTSISGAGVVSASSHGSLAYLTSRFASVRLAWLDEKGRETKAVPLDPGPYQLGALSPDDRQAVVERIESPDQSDLWTVDLERGVASRLTSEVGNSGSPIWSPDGSRIAYMWDNRCPQVFKIRSATGGTAVENYLASDPLFKQIDDWTKDGKYIVYERQDPATRWDLWLLPMEGDHQPRPYLTSPFNEQRGQVSPDGRWIAYTSDESGQREIYVQSFPDPGNKYQVTNRGGEVRGWSRDGKKFIFSLRSNLRVGLVSDVLPGPALRLGPPHVGGEVPETLRGGVGAHQTDGYLGALLAGKEPVQSIMVVLNWPAALVKR